MKHQSVTTETFRNPIVTSGADPWVTFWKGNYYYCYAIADCIYVSKTNKLQDIGKVSPERVWIPPQDAEYSKEIWAPELHYLDNKWYIYFAADDGNNANHRMYVLEGNSQNPQGSYLFRGKISAPTDRWSIDGTVLILNNSKYFVWSGWEGFENVQQNLYIASMDSPRHISGERICISTPEFEWEKVGKPYVNEGPQALKREGRVHIVYSASGSWTDDYCLGQLTYIGGNALRKESWVKRKTPVFSKTSTVFGPGHASFVKSPDGVQDWIVYHAAKHRGAGWNRSIRTQQFTWAADNSPNFGFPISIDVPIEKPLNFLTT
jgi:GH43 family beta-xylosidase